MAIEGNKYSQEYLNSINDVLRNRMDGNQDGQKDGKVTIAEAYKDLNVGGLLSGLKEGSAEYNKLKALTDKVPQALQKYAGSDGIFQNEEWADFLNGDEWRQVIDTYRSSSNFAKIEMGWVDNSVGNLPDGKATKGEVKVGLLRSLSGINLTQNEKQKICNTLEILVDKYAGEDGTFTVEEYTAMKNDPEYKQITNDIHLEPFGIDRRAYLSLDIEFAKSLPKNPEANVTILQIGNDAEKTKGYYAKNPATGKTVYADENGRLLTKDAFENWEQLAKD